MKTILYLGVDARSAAFAEAVVGKAARDETVNVYDPDVNRAGDINRYGLSDIPCMARIGTITETDGEGNETQREVCVYQTSDPDALPTFKLDADAAAAELGAE